jgi:putative two-component system response regulator
MLSPEQLVDMRIMVVDDSAMNLAIVRDMLKEAGHENVVTETDPVAAVESIKRSAPDLLLLDIHMPKMNGLQVLASLESLIDEPTLLPVCMLTSDGSTGRRREALALGARDFITKPFDEVEVVIRCRNMLRTRHLQVELERRNLTLFEEVRARTRELEAARMEMLMRLALTVEFRDDDTHDHAMRIGRTAAAIGKRLGLDEPMLDLIENAAPLHDVGKVGIADGILLKPGPLTPAERTSMQRHTLIGSSILAGSISQVLRMGAEIALSHHEWYDGTGYPHNLQGHDIPLPARIVAVADVFDALTHVRPYKEAWSIDQALDNIHGGSGKQFDPMIVDAFLALDHVGLLKAAA